MQPTPESDTPAKESSGNARALRRIAALAAYLAVGLTAWFCWHRGLITPQSVQELTASQPLLAPLVFIAAYGLAMAFAIPTLPFNVAAGYIWGAAWGGLAALAGAITGCSVAFWMARAALGQPLDKDADNRMAKWLAAQVERHGWKAVAFVRLNPAFPCGLANYVFGLTSLRYRTYFVASTLAMGPLSFGFAWLGHSAGSALIAPNAGSVAKLLVAASGLLLIGLAGRALFRWHFGRQPGEGTEKGSE